VLEIAIIAVVIILASRFALTSSGEDAGAESAPLPSSLGGILKLSAAEIATYAKRAGFSGDDLAIAISVAIAESSGNPVAYNPETAAHTPEGQGSFGLWQIYVKVHPEFSGQDLYDPQTNANAAFQIYSQAGRTFKPWSTFKNNAYLAYLDEATAYA